MSDFGGVWASEDVMVVKRRLLRRLFLIWSETDGDEMDSLDADLQVVLRDGRLAERLSTEFSWAETSEIILACRYFKCPIYVWVLYPGSSESMLALVAEPPGWCSREPVYLWNVVTKNGKGDHYCALERHPHCSSPQNLSL